MSISFDPLDELVEDVLVLFERGESMRRIGNEHHVLREREAHLGSPKDLPQAPLDEVPGHGVAVLLAHHEPHAREFVRTLLEVNAHGGMAKTTAKPQDTLEAKGVQETLRPTQHQPCDRRVISGGAHGTMGLDARQLWQITQGVTRE